MRLRHLALAVVLVLILNAGITYGIVQWASPSGAQGPPGPVATADAKALACAAAISAQPPENLRYKNPDIAAQIAKYCP